MTAFSIVNILHPQEGETVYDSACGTLFVESTIERGQSPNDKKYSCMTKTKLRLEEEKQFTIRAH